MPKKTKSEEREVSKLPKISIPGIQIKELLELESLFPDIRKHLCTIMFAVILIAQIRVSLSSCKPAVIQSLESVNTYTKKLVSKNASTTYVAAAVAIRKTMIAHAEDADESNILASHLDLSTNLTGPLTTKGGISAAISSAENLRKYRRGLMAQVVGTLQSCPIHTPRKIHMNMEHITTENFLPLLPFSTEDINIDEIISLIRQALITDPQLEKINFNDLPSVNLGSTSLESSLPIERTTPKLPDLTNVPRNIDSLPTWKQAAIQQARNLKTGL
jgi:hypothetical protein